VSMRFARGCNRILGLAVCLGLAAGQDRGEHLGEISSTQVSRSVIVLEWQRQMQCGERYYKERRLTQAETCFTSAILAAERSPVLSIEHAQAVSNLAIVLLEQDRTQEAEGLATHVVEMIRKCRDGSCELTLAGNLRNLALVYRRQRRLFEAEKLLMEALRLYSGTTANARDIAGVLHVLGSLELDRDRPAAAERHFRRALSEIRDVKDATAFRANLYAALSNTLLRLGRGPEAVAAARSSIAVASSDGAAGSLEMAGFWCTLGAANSATGDYASAEDALIRAQRVLSLAADSNLFEVGTMLNAFANLRFLQKRFPEAAHLQSRALAVLEQHVSSSDPQVLNLKARYAIMLRKLNRKGEAKQIERQIKEATRVAHIDPGVEHKIDVSDLRQESRRLRRR
jgi:tetratricopeptide (TPR) repeat protein